MRMIRICFVFAACFAFAGEWPAQAGAQDKSTVATPAAPAQEGQARQPQIVRLIPTGDSKTLEPVEHPLTYPAEAREKGIEGKVIVKVSVLETGAVESVEPVSGDPILLKGAVEAVQNWTFKPFIRGGKAIKVASNLPVSFALPGAGDAAMVEPIKIVAPAYPRQAEAENMQGQALVRTFINETGDVEKEEIVESTDHVFNQPALDAVKQWKFKPYLADGKAIPVAVKLPVDFAFSDNVHDGVMPELKYPREVPAPSDAPKPTEVASGVVAGKLIHRVDPTYPWQARNWHIQGDVLMKALITKEGRIGSLQLVSGEQALAKSAMGAVQQWRYQPLVLNGKPVEVHTIVTVHFTLAAR